MQHNRRKIRSGLKVWHRHRVGKSEIRTLSELIIVNDHPRAILGWIDVGGVRTPAYQCELDPKRLHKAAANPGIYYYDGVTVDPRYQDVRLVTDRAPPPQDA